MPSRTTTTTMENGLLSRERYSWGGNMDHVEYWVECPHCGCTLIHSDDSYDDDDELDADIASHAAGKCAKDVAQRADAQVPVDCDDPF